MTIKELQDAISRVLADGVSPEAPVRLVTEDPNSGNTTEFAVGDAYSCDIDFATDGTPMPEGIIGLVILGDEAIPDPN